MSVAVTWAEANRRYTATALRRVAARLEAGNTADLAALRNELAGLAATMARPPALIALSGAFGLSEFEQDVLLLCAGIELDDAVRGSIRSARGNDSGLSPTFGLALAVLPNPHWSALSPAAPLRRWHLINVAVGGVLTATPLHIEERVLHYLAGVHYIDDSVGLRSIDTVPELPFGQAAVARRAAACVANAEPGRAVVVQLSTRRPSAGYGVAARTAADLGLSAALLRAEDVPAARADRQDLARRIEREAVLAGLLPVLDGSGADRDALKHAARLVDAIAGPMLVVASYPLELARQDVRLSIPTATPAERREVWVEALGPAADHLNGQLDRASELFDLDSADIRRTAKDFVTQAVGATEDCGSLFWTLARERARPKLDHLTERVAATTTWDMLVLPDTQRQLVRDIAVQARWRATVHRDWAFGEGNSRGLGISALFSGPSGTGKTMTAEVIAADLGLDLYRIDLSRVVSKYIGETEKNLGSVFDEAEGAGAILLFDEADALFGKRSEVNDSHDRYANLEVSYLLQRMEAYDGLAILTTNQRSALDPAFLRRIRFAVQFPFPDTRARAEIWRRCFPPAAPTEGLDFGCLAQLNVAGGHIRNMALNAAFHAAAAGSPIRMQHLLLAARAEFAKLERALPEAQVRGWS